MAVCEKHQNNPARIYGECVGCEIERLRYENTILRRELQRYSEFENWVKIHNGWDETIWTWKQRLGVNVDPGVYARNALFGLGDLRENAGCDTE